MNEAGEGSILIGQRNITLPGGLSEQARQLFITAPQLPAPAYPPLEDVAAWKHHIAEFDAAFIPLLEGLSANIRADIRRETVSGIPVFRATPHNRDSSKAGRVILYAHGGALIYLSGEGVAPYARLECERAGCEVVAVDYRMPPEHPYPAGLDDMLAVYRGLLPDYRNDQIAIVGLSAGSNLAAATALRIRDEGLPPPAAVVLFTPELDLTETGDSFQVLLGLDLVLRSRLMPVNRLYADGADLRDPYLSPIFADFSTGFPPTFLQSGTRDLFLSNAVRMHRALCHQDIECEIHLWDGMPHGGFGGASPEDEEVSRLYRNFLNKYLE